MAQKGGAGTGKGKGASDVSVIAPVDLREALEERYLRYALSTITGRALPDARDGLKPVHRRILYGMHILRLDPGAPFKKCAKIVGDVMGSFHPHGDQAIYDALVRLAQDFSSRYPLVDGQGNFGNVDGDSAAAYRYTEARMTGGRAPAAGRHRRRRDRLHRPNYSGEEKEPVVLPVGAARICSPMARRASPSAWRRRSRRIISPNSATRRSISSRTARRTPTSCSTFVQGPDFPTGGIIVDKRERDHREPIAPGAARSACARAGRRRSCRAAAWVVVVTEIPYSVQKSRLIEKLAELISEQKLPLVADVRDEFGRGRAHRLRAARAHGRSGADDGDAVQALRARNALPDEHERARRRRDAARRFARRGAEAMARPSPRPCCSAARATVSPRSCGASKQLEGMLIVFLNLDEVIRIIREEDDAKGELKKALQAHRCAGRTTSSTRGCAPCAGSKKWS